MSTGSDTVPVVPLPDIIRSAEQAFGRPIRPSVIKIDVEGYEPQVWDGMRDYIAMLPHVTILMEFTPSRYLASGVDPVSFFKTIQSAGFKISALSHDSAEKPFGLHDIEAALKSNSYADIILRK